MSGAQEESRVKKPLKFVLLLGVVSLFADMTYEGARSIIGPYLAVLGASGAAVGVIAGLGELLGYGVRLLSGYISDRTGKYWFITFFGYFLNLFAVPMLALAGRWETAAILMMAERIGKAVRVPPRDTMLSHATKEIGRGWGFGLHEALDQTGAMLGPLIVSLVMVINGRYESGFAVLAVPAVLAISVLATARLLYPNPRDFEKSIDKIEYSRFPKKYWFYLLAVAFIAFGYVDYPLIAFHFKKISMAADNLIPIFYAVAMGVDALAALILGRLFDRYGLAVLIVAAAFSMFFAPLVFGGSFYFALIGMVLWGIGMGAQESIMRAVIAEMIPLNKRGSAYGLFNAGYGLFWFMGSALLGIVYDISIPALIAVSVLAQLAALPLLIKIIKLNE
ncbi:MAG: MFS transporter [Peptococcaceae bacterium]|jgi:MFS family permease|nr:MFS transporter [Peptococcaceae bacterium]MDH7524910.1 MFS transporter [Peptococcaceae bacterium]